jgi:hypothetical protein
MSDERRNARAWPVWLALLGACVFAIGGSTWAAREYGGDAFWPGLVGNFVASLLAFILALWWERTREQAQLRHGANDLQEQRRTEVRRRLEPVRAELDRNRNSLEQLVQTYTGEPQTGSIWVLHPLLLDTAWAANAARLTELVADYQLTSDLSTAYGRIEELRWRLRQRTATISVMAGSEVARITAGALETISRPLVSELLTEVGDLIVRVDRQRQNPDVQPLGLLHLGAATVRLNLTASGSG